MPLSSSWIKNKLVRHTYHSWVDLNTAIVDDTIICTTNVVFVVFFFSFLIKVHLLLERLFYTPIRPSELWFSGVLAECPYYSWRPESSSNLGSHTAARSFLVLWWEPPTFGNSLDSAAAVFNALNSAACKWTLKPSDLLSSTTKYFSRSFGLITFGFKVKDSSTYPLLLISITTFVLRSNSLSPLASIHPYTAARGLSIVSWIMLVESPVTMTNIVRKRHYRRWEEPWIAPTQIDFQQLVVQMFHKGSPRTTPAELHTWLRVCHCSR